MNRCFIQDALNAQTFSQFRAYAEQQYPDNPDQQAVLIRQLQEQHYFQYMQQIYQQQMETHASDEISKERQRRHEVQQVVSAVDDLDDGVSAIELGDTNGAGVGAGLGESDDNEDDVDEDEYEEAEAEKKEAAEDEDDDCDYCPEDYHDENSELARYMLKEPFGSFGENQLFVLTHSVYPSHINHKWSRASRL